MGASEPPFPPGPGAKTTGEPKYAAVQQLLDQLKQNPETGTAQKLSWADKQAEAWQRGKDAVTRSIGKALALREPLRDLLRGVRSIKAIEPGLGHLDFILQQSVARSKAVGEAIRHQFKDDSLREAAMLWIDSGGEAGEALLRDAATKLPEGTSPRIRKAVNLAANLSPEGRALAESLRQYYGIRGNDALETGVMEHLLNDYATHIWRKSSNIPEKIRAAFTNGRLSSYFQFSRQRKIPMFLEGILQGKVPVLDPADVIPFYNHALDRAIATREFVKEATENIIQDDGRPTFAPSGVRSVIGPEDNPKALLITPRAKGRIYKKGSPETTAEEAERVSQMNDYMSVEHPAMRKWRWAGTDENGAPILYQSDLLVHPKAYERIARIMDRGRLTPSPVTRALLRASTETKGFKLGFFSLFHPVHVGSHALFHWTNPFKELKSGPIDWEHPNTQFAVEKGHLKLAPSAAELNAFAEGNLGTGLVHKVPFIGQYSKALSEWTFGEYIPKLKLATFNNAYRRAIWMRDKFGAYKGLSEDQIASRIGDSVNNAFGELNHWFLNKDGRDPKFQRSLRLAFLAPDFGEARLRFAEKAVTRYGHEERLAFLTMFTSLYLGARVANMISTGDPQADWRHAFSVKVGDHWWTMRSVVGDLDRMFTDFGSFMYVRMNPLYTRTAIDILYGRDVQGRRLTPGQKFVKRPLEQFLPIQLGGLTRDDQKLWESFVTAMGVQTFRDSPVRDVQQMVSDWKESSSNPRLRAQWERQRAEVLAPSDYATLRTALTFDDEMGALKAYRELIAKGKDPRTIEQTLNPSRPFSGAKNTEQEFINSLTPDQRTMYGRAVEQRKQLYERYKAMLRNNRIPTRSKTFSAYGP